MKISKNKVVRASEDVISPVDTQVTIQDDHYVTESDSLQCAKDHLLAALEAVTKLATNDDKYKSIIADIGVILMELS